MSAGLVLPTKNIMDEKRTIETALTALTGCSVPIIVAPMFLVSNKPMVVAGSEAGAIGSFPALNFRPIERFQTVLREIKSETNKPFAVNLIVNKSNIYLADQVKITLDQGVPLIIASLGNPTQLIREAHQSGSKVLVDVVNLEHALKAQDAGADAIIAVDASAGGHHGQTGFQVLVPFLRAQLSVPIIAAGGIATGAGLAAALALGAAGVVIGTRFIASQECAVIEDYKRSILDSSPDDIVTTWKLDGLPAHVINTDYVKRVGTHLSWIERLLLKNKRTRQSVITTRALRSFQKLGSSAQRVTWKQLWGAGQSVGLVYDIKPVRDIISEIVAEYYTVINSLPH